MNPACVPPTAPVTNAPLTTTVLSLKGPVAVSAGYIAGSGTGFGGSSVAEDISKWATLYPDLYGPTAKDPDNGTGDEECNDEISKILNKYTGIGGTFSTWSERHAFILGAQIGYLHVKSSADVPPVPIFFLDEAHYWRTGIIMGRAAAKAEAVDWKAIVAAVAAGGIGVQGLIKYIFPLIGV